MVGIYILYLEAMEKSDIMSKMDDCYKISDDILSNYVKIFSSTTTFNNCENMKWALDEIKRMVVKEAEIIHSVSLDEIQLYVDGNYDIDGKNPSVLTRIISKLNDYKEILCGRSIVASELGLSGFIDDSIQFSIYDAIISMINIDAIKLLKDKIDMLTPDCQKDFMFVAAMHDRINYSRLYFLLSTSLAERLVLSSDVNVEKIPRINVDRILTRCRKNNVCNNKFLYDVLLISAKQVMTMIFEMNAIEDNYNGIFHLLVLITRMEILISYMNKEALLELKKCCELSLNDGNTFGIRKVRELISSKLNG